MTITTPHVFFITPPAPCPYLPGRTERRVVASLDELPAEAFDALTGAGFRRSQRFVYKPNCLGCQACVSVRILARRFVWTRSFRRIRARNRDLLVRERAPRVTEEQYALFSRYLDQRHTEGGMQGMRFEEYREMVEDGTPRTRLIEFRDRGGRLLAVSLTDRVADGFSGVYKFFDPAERRRSLGTEIVLWHVQRACELNLPHVYLGYWIAGCRKMEYKSRFRPLERLEGASWMPFAPDGETRPPAP